MEKTQDWLDRIKAAESLEGVAHILQSVNLHDLPLRQFTVISRAVKACGEAPGKRMAYIGNFVLDMLPNYLDVFAARQSLALAHYVGGFNQYFQEVLDQDSGLRQFQPDVILLALSMRQLNPDLSQGFAGLEVTQKQEMLDNTLEHLDKWVQTANDYFACHLIVANFPLPHRPQLGVADQKDAMGEMAYYFELNRRIYNLFAPYHNVFVLDAARLCAQFGLERVFDPKMYYLAKVEWAEAFLPRVSDELMRLLTAADGGAKKCLVLDLDNTLWGGVVGEDGPRGVKVGVGDPVSEAYADFQRRVLSLKKRGILLTICSKNNAEDVKEMFNIRDDMPLKLDDFAATRINWAHKSKNIAELAAELNIGLDSMVFIDDNPAECELVRQMLPQVYTLELPPNSDRYASLLDEFPLFEKSIVLASDRQKTRQYAENRQRQALKESTEDLTAYLHSLGTMITIRKPADIDLDRVHQLFTKTNQFNVTTIRYSATEVDAMLASGELDLIVVDAKDKFGNLGTIGLYLVRHGNDVHEVDSFILSCRAMGRGIEDAVMNHLKRQCFEKYHAEWLRARYTPTPKNKPVSDFFESQGFEVSAISSSGEKSYRLEAVGNIYSECDWIKVTTEDHI